MKQPILTGCMVTLKTDPGLRGIVIDDNSICAKVRLEDGRILIRPVDSWEWTKAPSEPVLAWKSVQVIGETDSPMGRLLILRHPDGGKSYANPGAMHPIPTMAAEDAAVLHHAELLAAFFGLADPALPLPANLWRMLFELDTAVRALNAALTPAPMDTQSEITSASRALQAALDRAQKNITPERDRLRAALAREPK